MELLKIALALHGSLILLVGLLGGVFFAKAITSGKGEVANRLYGIGTVFTFVGAAFLIAGLVLALI